MEELRNREGKKQLPLFEMGHLQWVTHSGIKDVLNKSYFTGILKTCFTEKGLVLSYKQTKYIGIVAMKSVQEDTCFRFDKPFKIQGKQPICYRRQEILCISVMRGSN